MTGSFIIVAVVAIVVVSFSVTLDDGQYQYIIATKDSDESKSARIRELIDKGMDAEEE